VGRRRPLWRRDLRAGGRRSFDGAADGVGRRAADGVGRRVGTEASVAEPGSTRWGRIVEERGRGQTAVQRQNTARVWTPTIRPYRVVKMCLFFR
jgi:hypothetical protein